MNFYIFLSFRSYFSIHLYRTIAEADPEIENIQI